MEADSETWEQVKKLVDIKKGSFDDAGYNHAAAHFWTTFSTAFPRVAQVLAATTGPVPDDAILSHKYRATAANTKLAETMATPRSAIPSALRISGSSTVSARLTTGNLDTGFLTRVNVSPNSGGPDARQAAGAVTVTGLQATKERPKTQFGAHQRSHWISFELGRRALESQQGRTVAQVCGWLEEGLDSLKGRPPHGALNDSWKVLFDQVRKLLAGTGTLALSAHQWSEVLASLTRGYFILHNAHDLASWGGSAVDGGASFGHSEAKHLRELEHQTGLADNAVKAEDKKLAKDKQEELLAEEKALREEAKASALGLLDTDSIRNRMLQTSRFWGGSAVGGGASLLPVLLALGLGRADVRDRACRCAGLLSLVRLCTDGAGSRSSRSCRGHVAERQQRQPVGCGGRVEDYRTSCTDRGGGRAIPRGFLP